MRRKNQKYNTLAIGTIIGLVVPMISILFFYLFTSDRFGSFSNFINQVVAAQIFMKILSLCAIPNLIVFYLFLNRKYNETAKGVIFATFILTIIVIITKL